MWGSQSWLQPPFEAAPLPTSKRPSFCQAETSLASKEPPERRLQPRWLPHVARRCRLSGRFSAYQGEGKKMEKQLAGRRLIPP
jgi:hypothetical protein